MTDPRAVTTDNWGSAPFNRWSFRHVQELFPTCRLARGTDAPPALPIEPRPLLGIEYPTVTGEKIVLRLFDTTGVRTLAELDFPTETRAELERFLKQTAGLLLLTGPAGSGKTHLLRALAHACQQQGLRVGWLEAQDAASWGLDPTWSLLLIDDVHRLDPQGQQAAFALLVDAQTLGITWAAAGDGPPVDLPLREDLRTRLGWGHTFALEPLGDPETRAVLRREADRRGILLNDEVMDYLLTRFPRDLKSQMRLLDRLDEGPGRVDDVIGAGPLLVPGHLRPDPPQRLAAAEAAEPQAPKESATIARTSMRRGFTMASGKPFTRSSIGESQSRRRGRCA